MMLEATYGHCCWFSTKMLLFGNKCCFFLQILYFYMNETSETWKNNICCWKTTFLLKIGNNDHMLLLATIIATCAHAENSRENQLSEPKNLKFRYFLQIDFELHMCCHVTDLSNITNWQHVGRGPSGKNFCRNFCLPHIPELEFHLWRRFFSEIDKISNFQQQKQLLLFLSNITPKVLICWFLLLGPHTSKNKDADR